MKHTLLTKLAKKLNKLMKADNMTAKELSKKSGISYTTLNPILNGTQECGFTKLVQIAEALNVSPNELLADLYVIGKKAPSSDKKINYHVVLISVVKVSYCLLYDLTTDETSTLVLQFPLRCGETPNVFIDNILVAIEKLSDNIGKKIVLKETAVFLSVLQYGRTANREKIMEKAEHAFGRIWMESDALTNYKAFVGYKNGICISINDGDAITFSNTEGKNIEKLHGYGFPISDVAGNYWLGCEAIKHTIRVKEGLDKSSLLSDRLLALYDDDIYLLAANTMENPSAYYSQASTLIKELAHDQKKSYEIIQESANLLLEHVKIIDKKTNQKLPIVICGELADLYEPFFPQARLLKIKRRQNELLLEYGLKFIKAAINTENKI